VHRLPADFYLGGYAENLKTTQAKTFVTALFELLIEFPTALLGLCLLLSEIAKTP